MQIGCACSQPSPARSLYKSRRYTLHKILPSKVDPLVSLMKLEKVPDSTYDMVGGLDKQIQEIKEVRRPSTDCASLCRCLGCLAVFTYRHIKTAHLLVSLFLLLLLFFHIVHRRSSSCQLSTQNCSNLWVWLSRRGCCCMVLPAPARHFWHELWHITQTALSLEFLALNSSRSTLAKEAAWCVVRRASCVMRHASCVVNHLRSAVRSVIFSLNSIPYSYPSPFLHFTLSFTGPRAIRHGPRSSPHDNFHG